MPTVNKAQVGFKTESTYGTAVTVDRFSEFVTEKIKPMSGRVVSKGMRSGQRVRRKDRQVPYKQGAAGPVQVEVLSAGFGWWLAHMLGSSATTGPTDSAYTHTGTLGTLTGKSFTFQTNRPFHPADTDQAITFEGGKIPKWKLSNKVGEVLVAEFDLDFEDWATGTALASASYPTAAEPLSFVGGAVTIGGSSVDISEIEVSCDNKLFGVSSTDERRYLRASSLHKEPVEGDLREISWSIGCDWESLTQFNRVHSATAAGALATIVATWTGSILIGTASVSSLTLTIDEASFDDLDSTVDGPAPLTQKLTGAGLYDGSTSPVTLAYVSGDSTA